MLILRKINRDGMHYGFQWPLEVGATVECPHWRLEPCCGNGLHGLPEGCGSWGLLIGYYWVVIEADESNVVMIDDKKCKFRCGIIKAICDPGREDVGNFLRKYMPQLFETAKDREAYFWAKYIGDRDIMIHRVTDPNSAFIWALDIGDRDIMRDRVTDSMHAYWWARYIGDHDVMWLRVKDDPRYAKRWKENIGEPPC